MLHMMTHLMRDYISLRKIARRTETILQLVVKAEVDVKFFIFTAVKRPHR